MYGIIHCQKLHSAEEEVCNLKVYGHAEVFLAKDFYQNQ